MGFKLVYGCQQDNLTAEMDQRIAADYSRYSDDYFICLVPNHIKFNREVQVLDALGKALPNLLSNDLIASTRLQTLSFSRLLWYFLRDDPFYAQPQLTPTTQAMILSNILNRNHNNFPIFFGERRRIGFLEQLGQQLTEFAQGNFTDNDLQELQEKLLNKNVPGSTAAKLKELTLIYKFYQQEITSKFTTNEQLMSHLISQVKQRDFKHYHFYLLGFSDFSQQQLQLLKSLSESNATIYLSLYLPEHAALRNTYYFQQPQSILAKFGLEHIIDQHPEDCYLVTQKRVSSELQQLENYWIEANNSQQITTADQLKQNNIQIWQADSTTSEIRSIANYIRELVVLQHYRYRDFLVLANNLSPYTATIAAIFKQNEIPYFSDQQTMMTDHPLSIFIQALLKLSQKNWRLTDLFDVLRTELLIPKELNIQEFRTQLDWLENYALKYGLRPYHWLQTSPWQNNGPYATNNELNKTTSEMNQTDQEPTFPEIQFMAIEHLHQFVANILGAWHDKVSICQTGRDFATELFLFLKNNDVITKLQDWEKQATNDQDLTLAQQPKQTYQALIAILDDYVAVWGEDAFNLELFTDLLASGFANTQFAQIPSTLDAVAFSEFGIVQGQTQKIAIVIGATRANLPQQEQANRLIDDQERQLINEINAATDEPKLNRSLSQLAVERPLRFGTVFLSGSERLIFTFPGQIEEKGSTVISPYVKQIKDFFKLPITHVFDYPKIDDQHGQILNFSASKRGVIGPLMVLARQQKDLQETLPPAWEWIKEQLSNDVDAEFYHHIFSSLNYQNTPVKLTVSNVDALYGHHLMTSVSQLENYFMNPYDYFLKYGLKLRKRTLFELNSADTGNFFHAYLDNFLKLIQQSHLNLGQLTPAELNKLNQQLTKTLLADNNFSMLNGPGQMNYYAHRLSQTSAYMTTILQQQAQHSTFTPFQTEVQFGPLNQQTGLSGLEFILPDGQQLSVRGKIDRIDTALINGKPYYQIIDYKSSSHKFDFTQVYYGLSLQLLTYLQTMRQNQHQLNLTNSEAIGAFYLQITDHPFNYKRNKDANLELLKDHRYRGLLVDDNAYLDQLDPQAIETSSPVYPLRYFKKSKTRPEGIALSRDDQGVTNTELDLLLAYNQRKIIEAASEIFSGELRLAPYRLTDKKNGLSYSDYQTIMMFDAMLPDNNYHEIIKLSKPEFLLRIKNENDRGE